MIYFKKLPKLIQLLLLAIPFVNEVVELIIRFTEFIDKKGLFRLVIAILCFPLGVFIGWIDFVLLLLNDKLLFID